MRRFDELRERLAHIHLSIALPEDRVEEFMDEVCRAVEKAGLKAMPRAEGYAFMLNGRVGALGLPHLRLAVHGQVVNMWVRTPYVLDGRTAAVGYGVDEYAEAIVRAARAAAEVYRRYGRDSPSLLLELPE